MQSSLEKISGLLAGLPVSEGGKQIIQECVVMNTIPLRDGNEGCPLVKTIMSTLGEITGDPLERQRDRISFMVEEAEENMRRMRACRGD